MEPLEHRGSCEPPRTPSGVHITVDTLGHLLALKVPPADQVDREQVAALAEEIQQVTGNTMKLANVDQVYPGPNAAEAASEYGIRLEVVKHPLANEVSCSCQDGGSSNEASPGPHVSADLLATMSGSTTHSKASTTTPSPC